MANNLSGFDKFCGGVLWDSSLTWYTEHPDFTLCFQRSVVVWVPCGFLWFLTPFYLWYLTHIDNQHGRSISKLNIAKTLVMLLLIAVTAVDLVKGAVDITSNSEDDVPLVLVVSPAIQIVTFMAAIVLLQIERRKGFVTSGVLWLFTLLLLIWGLSPFYSYIFRATYLEGSVSDVFRLTTFYIYYFFVIVIFLLFCFAELSNHEPLPNGKAPCPETEASFLSRITFWWINGIVYLGYKKSLVEDDLWALNPRDLTCKTAILLEQAWTDELRRCNWIGPTEETAAARLRTVPPTNQNGDFRSNQNGDIASTEKSSKDGPVYQYVSNPAYSDPSNDVIFKGSKSSWSLPNDKSNKKSPSLVRCLAKVYGPTLLVAHLCKLVCDCLTFVGPMIQSLLIEYTSDPRIETWKGYLYAVLFFITAVVNSFFFHQLFHIGMTLGMRIKAAMISLVYRKALTMSNEARKTTTVGEIVNLMSVDSQRLQDATGYLWMVWSSPLQIALAMVLLWQQLGPSVLAGLGVMICLIPVNVVLAGFQRKLQISQMKQKDRRIKLMNEILNGIKVLKLYAWELSFQDKINAIRNTELETLKKYAYIGGVGVFTWTCAPFIVISRFIFGLLKRHDHLLQYTLGRGQIFFFHNKVTLATFATYVASGGVLDAGKAFTSLSLFNILRFPINMLPMVTAYLVTAAVSVKRVGKFLQNRDIDEKNVQNDRSAADPIMMTGGTFAWGTTEDDKPVLKDVSMSIGDGSLTAIVGPVGVGKSSLLSAILGEMEKISGRVNLRGSVAYVAQQAWIQNATVRDNILFGRAYDEQRYNTVLDACALRPDLAILPAGDLTEIGEKGINLSGGQKQRVSIARAAYQDCDVYLFDDPLSAVDSHVGKHIFEKVLANDTGLLNKKTRVLVTNGLHFLPRVEQILVLVDGTISETGSYEQLLSHNGEFAKFLTTYLIKQLDETDDDDEEIQKLKSELLVRAESLDPAGGLKSSLLTPPHSPTSNTSVSPLERQLSKHGSENGSISRGVRRRGSRRISSSAGVTSSGKFSSDVDAAQVKKVEPPKDKDKLIQEENNQTGEVKLVVYMAYIRALGFWLTVLLLIFFLFNQVAAIGSNVFLSAWTEDERLINCSIIGMNESGCMSRQFAFLGIYGGIGGAQALFVLGYAIVGALINVRSARVLHDRMLVNVLRSPMMFFETTPMGRILNRFSRDIETIDNVLPQLMRSWLQTAFSVVAIIIIISYSTPIFLSVVLPLGVLYYFVQRFYIPSSRQMKRIESTTRSPIYVHFSETISGCSTIRAYQKEITFTEHNEKLVDHNLVFYFATIASNRWLGFRLEVLGGLIILSAAMFAVIGRDTIAAGVVGLSLSYALQITQSLNWMVRMTTDMETNIVSVERVKEYCETPQEADWHEGALTPAADWPSKGHVEFKEYMTQYRPGLGMVLNGISVDIQPGEKVGIVGRTGAGKSSMTVALFRLIEAVQGSIVIDELRIADMGLYKLRSKLTILPQDPVLFSGTLRMNLDPFDTFDDDRIWSALEHAHMKEFTRSLAAGLEYEVGEGGQNLSVGQRQLVCLARTLLRKTKILILDEATAAVDMETDELIQKTIRQEFTDCTILTIAHRLNTILDSDRVMVLDEGRLKEFDNPKKLLDDKLSLFHGLARDAGLVT